MEEIEVRCPNAPNRLFMKLLQDGDRPHVTSQNLLEMACSDCKRQLRMRGRQVSRVLHRYDFAGEFVESEVVR